MGYKRAVIAGLAALLLLGGCGRREPISETESVPEKLTAEENSSQTPSTVPQGSEETVPETSTPPTSPSVETTDICAALTLEQKVAQLFILAPEDFMKVTPVTAAGEQTKERLRQYPISGYVYFESNIVSPDQLRTMNENLQQYSMETIGLPFFIAVDEEGGKVLRIADVPGFGEQPDGNMSDVGASGDSAQAYAVGRHIGGYLKKYGINVDFAPVADVYTNPENEVVRYRSFGSDPQMVSQMVSSFLQGVQEEGICGAVKHFPGHGATAADTHAGYALVDRTLDELRGNELVPFARAAQEGVPFIMVGHLSLPQVTGDDAPATLSHLLITDVLRKELGYDGIVITDAMKMGAITQQYSPADAAIRGIQAGVDIILMPADFEQAYNGILEAVASGQISEERIDESVRRIIDVKQSLISDQ